MNFTHLVFFHFWAGAGTAPIPPSQHAAFVHISSNSRLITAVSAGSSNDSTMLVSESALVTGGVLTPITTEVTASPSLITTLGVIP